MCLSSVQHAVTVINSLASDRLPALLTKIAQRTHTQVHTVPCHGSFHLLCSIQTAAILTLDEQKKLEDALELSSKDASLLIDTITFIFETVRANRTRITTFSSRAGRISSILTQIPSQEPRCHQFRRSTGQIHSQKRLSMILTSIKAKAIVAVWQAEGAAVIQRVRGKAFYPCSVPHCFCLLSLFLTSV